MPARSDYFVADVALSTLHELAHRIPGRLHDRELRGCADSGAPVGSPIPYRFLDVRSKAAQARPRSPLWPRRPRPPPRTLLPSSLRHLQTPGCLCAALCRPQEWRSQLACALGPGSQSIFTHTISLQPHCDLCQKYFYHPH